MSEKSEKLKLMEAEGEKIDSLRKEFARAGEVWFNNVVVHRDTAEQSFSEEVYLAELVSAKGGSFRIDREHIVTQFSGNGPEKVKLCTTPEEYLDEQGWGSEFYQDAFAVYWLPPTKND